MSAELLARWRGGDEAAAEALYRLYAHRLIGLARSRLAPKLRQRFDPEDVVQSAFRSFFRMAREETFLIQPNDDLWALLARITVNKALLRIDTHHALRRSVAREVSPYAAENRNGLMELVAREPSPEDLAAATDELQKAMADLVPLHRQMVEFLLQGETILSVAAATRRTERMVRLVVARFRTKLEGQLLELKSL